MDTWKQVPVRGAAGAKIWSFNANLYRIMYRIPTYSQKHWGLCTGRESHNFKKWILIQNTTSNFQEMNVYYRKVVFGMYFETLSIKKWRHINPLDLRRRLLLWVPLRHSVVQRSGHVKIFAHYLRSKNLPTCVVAARVGWERTTVCQFKGSRVAAPDQPCGGSVVYTPQKWMQKSTIIYVAAYLQ